MINAESTVAIKRPVADVFDFVSDPRNEPKWHTDVVEVEPISNARPGSEAASGG